jgi:hypothetical protein
VHFDASNSHLLLLLLLLIIIIFSSSSRMEHPTIGLWPPVLQISEHEMFYGERLSSCRPTPNLEDQVSVLMTLGRLFSPAMPLFTR